MATQANLDYVQKMFVAYLGRASSASAQEYYADLIDANPELGKAQLFDDLYNSAEAQALYAGKTDDQIITMIFQNCFNRDPAFSGLTYYYDEIQKGTFNILEAAGVIADGADAAGAATLAAKQTAADKITTEMGSDATAIANYAANSGEARESLNKVTDTASATAYDATAELAAISTGNQVGTTFTLTTAADAVNGTIENDTVVGDSTTYQSTDLIIDGTTTDSDVMTVTASSDMAAVPTVTNVESVNFNLDSFTSGGDAIFDVAVTNISGANAINVDVTKSGSSIDSAIVTGAKTGGVFNFGAGISTAVTVTAAADNEALTVTSSAASITANSAGTLTAATVTGNGAATTTTTVVSDTDAALTATTSASDMTVTAAGAKTVVLTSAKDIDANTTDLTAATSVTLTAGNEVDVGLDAATTATISAGGTVTSQVDDAAGNTLTSLSLSGNGSKHTFDIADSEGVATVTLTGDQDVTVTTTAANVTALTNDQLTVTDSSTGTSTLILSGNSTSDVDVSVVTTDVINISGDQQGVIEVASGQTITASVDQTSMKLDGADATASSNSATLILDDGVTTADGAADATALTFTDLSAVTVDVSKDSFPTGTYTAASIGGMTGTADNTSVTINAGANGVTLAGTHDLSGATGGGALTINSDGAVALGTSTFDVASLTHTGKGAVTMTATSTEVNAVTTGSGIDTLTFDGLTDTLTVNSGAGNDSVVITASTAATKNYTIDMGDGTTDTLTIGANTLDLNNGATFTLVNAEKISFADNVTAVTVGASLLDGKSYLLNHADAADTIAITIELGTANSIDLSNLVTNGLNMTAADSMVVNGSAKTAGLTLTGANTVSNTLTGGTKDDTITGGDVADTLAGGAGGDTINGGAGGDTITGGDGADVLSGGLGNNTYQIGAGEADTGETIAFNQTTGATETIKVTAAADLSAINAGAKLTGLDAITIDDGATGGTATFSAAQLSGLTLTLTGVAGGGAEVLALTGTGQDDTITVAAVSATNATVTINALGGDDTIIGSDTADTIDGGTGSDTITGGKGDDNITLGVGSNVIVFSGDNKTANGSDTVTDFSTNDKLNLGNALTSGAIRNTTNTAGAITLASTGALAASGASIAVADQGVYLAEVATKATIDTEGEIATALSNGGVMDAVDFALNSTSILVVGGANDDTIYYVYAIDQDGTAAVTAGEVDLLATITSDVTAGMDGLVTGNFAF